MIKIIVIGFIIFKALILSAQAFLMGLGLILMAGLLAWTGVLQWKSAQGNYEITMRRCIVHTIMTVVQMDESV